MATLLYIHGFLSSPRSHKAQLTQQWLLQHRPDIHFACPQLTPYPDECHGILNEVIDQRLGQPRRRGLNINASLSWADVKKLLQRDVL